MNHEPDPKHPAYARCGDHKGRVTRPITCPACVEARAARARARRIERRLRSMPTGADTPPALWPR